MSGALMVSHAATWEFGSGRGEGTYLKDLQSCERDRRLFQG